MDEMTLTTQLRRYQLTLRAACKQILLLTDAAIDADDVQKHLNRHGRLSQNQSAVFGLFFELKQQIRSRHVNKAA